MGDIFVTEEIIPSNRFSQDQEDGEEDVQITEANARIPSRSNMPVVIRTYKGQTAQEVSH